MNTSLEETPSVVPDLDDGSAKEVDQERDFDGNLNNEGLAAVYPGLVGDWNERWDYEGPFLVGLFHETRKKLGGEPPMVLDACAGLGVELIMLGRSEVAKTLDGDTENEVHICDLANMIMYGNELDPNLRALLHRNIKDANVDNITVSGYRWDEFGERFEPEMFHNVLLTGNSIVCMDRNRTDELVASLQGIRKVMDRDNGRLLIDWRNWDKLIRNIARETFTGRTRRDKGFRGGPPLFNPLNNAETGVKVTGNPIAQFYDGMGNSRPEAIKYVYAKWVEDQRKAFGYLTMSTFNHDDLDGLYAAAGFKVAERMSDFQPGINKGAQYFQDLLEVDEAA